MIYESWVWKERLQEELTAFQSIMDTIYKIPEGLNDEEHDMYVTRMNSKIEQFIFLSAFMIRKLYEASKVSGELKTLNYACIKYPRIQMEDVIDKWNRHKIDEFYDFENARKISLSIETFYNMSIHSFIFEDVRDADKWIGILVNSDKHKDDGLFFIKRDTVVKIINDVIEDDVLGIISLRLEGKIYTTKYSGDKGQESLFKQMKRGKKQDKT